MKTKLVLVSSFLILAIMGLVFSNFKLSSTNDNTSAISNKSTEKTQTPPPPANNRWLDRFYIGGIQSIPDCNNNYPNLDWLGFNLWHNYTGSHTGELPNNRNTPYVNWICNPIANDKLMPACSTYASDVRARIDAIYQRPNMHNTKLLVSRPKINWLCYGQRSDYRCVELSHLDQNLWFYSFQTLGSVGADVQDNADNVLKWVRYCEATDPPTSGLVVSRLKANGEQSRRITAEDFGSIQWTGDSQCDWLIKPRIKVPVDFVTPINSETPVCRITVIAQDGNTVLKEVVITGKYFGIGTYDGKYKEDGFYFPPDTNLTIHGDWGNKWAWWVRGNKTPEEENENDCNHADIQVYWYGNCDMWLDYVRVDNDVASDLFSTDPNNVNHQRYEQWLQQEVEQIGMHIPSGASSPAVMKYYLEYAEFNNLPCIRYVNDKLKYWSQYYSGGAVTLDIMQDFTNILSCVVALENRTDIQNPDFLKTYYIEKAGYSQIFAECYPFIACWNVTPENQKFSKLPSTLPFTEDPDTILGKIVPPAEYESYLQDQLFHRPNIFEGADPSIGCYTEPFDRIYRNEGYFRYIMQTCDKISRDENIPFIFMPQAHQNYQEREVEREPTNEELNMTTNVALSYGAKGLLYFSYFSWHSGNDYGLGMKEYDDVSNELRTNNVYGENKKDALKELVTRISTKWGPYLLSFDNANRHSYIYDFSDERSALNSNSYFHYFATFKPGSGTPDCGNQEFTPENIPQGYTYDCADSTYLQIATFENTTPTKYFMIVNRRCSPVNENDNVGGKRKVRAYIKTNYPAFSGRNDWNIVDCFTDNTVTSFNSQNPGYIELGYFMPGEGKLYKIVPKVETGGSLMCDENIQGGTFTLQDTLYTNGYNLTIGFGTTINFTDSACIVVNGGSFTCGDVSQPTHERNIIFKGVTGNTWSGLQFNNCDLVNINSAQFQNVKGPSENTNYAVKLINCNTFNINNCTFTNSDPQKSGAIEANFSGDATIGDGAFYIAGNTFNMNTSDKVIVSVIANAECNVPVMLDNNIFTSTSNSATAMYLSFVSGVEIGGNAIVGYNKGIEMHYSNIDVIGNSITSTTGNNGAKGIDAEDFSSANLTSTGTLRTGGLNIFDNAGQNVNNIYVNDAYFYLDKGKNIFGITANSNSYHLKGYFPGDTGGNPVDETSNCFKVDNVAVVESNLPVKDVKWMESENDIDFYFFSYDCSTGSECDEMIVDMGNSVYDTICIIPGGSGGGVPSVQTVTPKKMYDSLCVLMHLRNFSLAKTKCYQLLTAFPDSSLSLNAVSKLYYLAVARDTSTVNITNVKTFLNTLILNHQNNLPLVRKCNYYVQKCKVKLKQYQSAMTGFQQIMQQNPYSYEALLASWDYAATHLLDSLNGPGGVSSNVKLQMLNVKLEEQEIDNIDFSRFTIDFSDVSLIPADELFEKMDKFLFNDDDKDAFTKEQRKSISTSVVTALDDSKKKSKNHIESLTKKSEAGNSDAKVELKIIKTLKEVVKIKKPKTIIEHIKSVNKDIQKLNTVKNETVKNVTSVIPVTYSLSQNYPNPFNPVTKINYELPKDGRVKLVIYDILGREIKILVNELKQAGRYTIEFNGNNYASGVYFYRILVENGKSYSAVKKMVLVK